jgi:hypothetical protein
MTQIKKEIAQGFADGDLYGIMVSVVQSLPVRTALTAITTSSNGTCIGTFTGVQAGDIIALSTGSTGTMKYGGIVATVGADSTSLTIASGADCVLIPSTAATGYTIGFSTALLTT